MDYKGVNEETCDGDPDIGHGRLLCETEDEQFRHLTPAHSTAPNEPAKLLSFVGAQEGVLERR
eukprot:12018257-Heterocapsa_arctica.AAC.1